MSENTNRATGEKVRFSKMLQNYSELNTQTSYAQISCTDSSGTTGKIRLGFGSAQCCTILVEKPIWYSSK